MKLLSADDMREVHQSKKTNNSRKIKEALTIKNLGVEVSQRKQEAIRDYVLFKKSDSSRCDKRNLYCNEGGDAEKIGLEQAKKKSVNL